MNNLETTPGSTAEQIELFRDKIENAKRDVEQALANLQNASGENLEVWASRVGKRKEDLIRIQSQLEEILAEAREEVAA
jgi:hypothetical protein